MGNFEGAKKHEQRQGFGASMAEMLRAKGFEVAQDMVQERVEEDQKRISLVGSQGESMPEIQDANEEAKEAFAVNTEETQVKLNEVVTEVDVDSSEAIPLESGEEQSEQKEKMLAEKSGVERDVMNVYNEIVEVANVIDRVLSKEDIANKDVRQLLIKFEVVVTKLKIQIWKMHENKDAINLSANTEQEEVDLQMEKLERVSESVEEIKREFQNKAESLIESVEVAGGGEKTEKVMNKIKALKNVYVGSVVEGDVERTGVESDDEIEAVTTLLGGTEAPEISEEPAPDSGIRRVVSEQPDTTVVDEAWPDTEEVVVDDRRASLRSSFRVIEGGKGKTEVDETGAIEIMTEDEVIGKTQKYAAPELLKEIPYPGPDDRRTTIGEDYLTPEEIRDFKPQLVKDVKEAGYVVGDIEEPEGLSMEEMAEEVKGEEVKNQKKMVELQQEEPLSLRELIEAEELAEEPVPEVTPEAPVAKDVLELFNEESEKQEQEESVMNLLTRFEGAASITQEEIDKIVLEAEQKLTVYRESFGNDDTSKLQNQFVERLEGIVDMAKARKEVAPQAVTDVAEGVSLRDAQNEGRVSPEDALIAAGAVAAAAAAGAVIEGGKVEVEKSPFETLESDVDVLSRGEWSESFAKGRFTEAYWNALSPEEKKRFVDLQNENVKQEQMIMQMKKAKDESERAFRKQYGNQFELNIGAQKTLQEKAGQIVKMEAILNRNNSELEMMREMAIQRVDWQGTEQTQSTEVTEEGEKVASGEEEVEKTSFFKEHPVMGYGAVGAGAVMGAGMMGAAYVGYRMAKLVLKISPMKILGKIGSMAEGFFDFLDKSIVKGDPFGAVSEVVKSAESKFDKGLEKLKGKEKEKEAQKKAKKKPKKESKGIQYSSGTE